MKKYSIGLLILVVLGGIWYARGVHTAKPEFIKIGAILPLSGGGLAAYGESIRNAINLAIEQSGEKDRIQLIVEDDHGCQTKDDATAAQKLISVDKVHVIIGAICTSPTLAIVPIAEENRVVVISPSASGKDLTQAGGYIFRTNSSDADKNITLGTYAYNKGFRKAAFIHDASQDASISQRDDTRDAFVKLGGKVVADESFIAKDKDMRTQLNKIKNSGADILFIGGLPDEIVLILKQAKAVGVTVAIASMESAIDPTMIAQADSSAEGLIVPASVAPTNKEVSDFISLYKAKYNAEPTQFAAEAYDAANLVITSAFAGDGSGESIKSHLEEFGQNYAGASGKISFDKNGDVKKPISMQQVVNGKLVDIK